MISRCRNLLVLGNNSIRSIQGKIECLRFAYLCIHVALRTFKFNVNSRAAYAFYLYESIDARKGGYKSKRNNRKRGIAADNDVSFR